MNASRRGHYTHGYSVTHPKLFLLWETMRGRCNNPNRERFKDYGGRGIKVCKEWNESCESFCKWALANGYKDGLQIDRIDNDGDYCPENCRFVTPKQNNRNRRNTVFLTVGAFTKCVAEWCEILPISPNTVYWWAREYGTKYAEKRIANIACETLGILHTEQESRQ